MKTILISAITVGTIIAITTGTLSYQETYNKKCIEGGDKVTGFLQCTGMNCDFGFPQNTAGISIPKKIFVSEKAQIYPAEAIAVLGKNNTVMWANHAPDEFVLEIDDGARIVLIPSCASAKMVFDKPGIFEYHEKSHHWITGKVIVLENDSSIPNLLEIKEFNNIQEAGNTISFTVRKTGFGGNYTINSQIIDLENDKIIDAYTLKRTTHNPFEQYDYSVTFPIRTSRIAIDEPGNYVLRIESEGIIAEKEFKVIVLTTDKPIIQEISESEILSKGIGFDLPEDTFTEDDLKNLQEREKALRKITDNYDAPYDEREKAVKEFNEMQLRLQNPFQTGVPYELAKILQEKMLLRGIQLDNRDQYSGDFPEPSGAWHKSDKYQAIIISIKDEYFTL